MESPVNKRQPKEQDENVEIVDLRYGVYAVRMAKTASSSLEMSQKLWNDMQEALPFLWRLSRDIFHTAPFYSSIYLLCQLTDGLESLVLLGYSDKLLKTVESGLLSGKPDIFAVIVNILYRIGFAFVFATIRAYSAKVRDCMHTKVIGHFELLVLKANLRLDLASAKEAENIRSTTSAYDAWLALERIMNLVTAIMRTGSQMAYIIHISRSSGGPFFVLLCLSHPILRSYLSSSPWSNLFYAYNDNPFYTRMKELESFKDDKLRQDVISGGLADWIVKQYEHAASNLGNISTEHPFQRHDIGDSIFKKMFFMLVEFSPVIYCVISATLNPTRFSVSSVAVLQQSASQLRSSVQFLFSYGKAVNRTIVTLKNLYQLQEDALTETDKGIMPYPPPEFKDTTEGMAFQLNNVCFSYPGSQSTALAIKDVSLNIKAGQLVVIVGVNGGGKSTLIRILSRLYEPMSGTVHIDGRPSRDYIASDLCQATALLSQDNQLYPLTLSENIGLGYPDKAHDASLVSQAADDGGAADFMSKLKDGSETILQPFLDIFQMQLRKHKSHVLYKELEQLRKKIDISGGERQKVVAARTFMRLRSGKIKFVAVDEPSSALDAEAELRLFQNLIKYREGKTLVFVTHRFGHLTKYADQIICMKDGSICESGSHEELIARQGEYAKLYRIQASAFSQN